MRRVVKILALYFAALPAAFAAEQPRMDMVKAIAPEYVGKYKKAETTNTAPDCEVTETTINLAGLGECKMISLIHITPTTGKDSYSAYLDDPKETWITLRKVNDETLEVRFLEKVTQKIVRSETYVRIK